jgi:hypothetical protein
VIRGDDNTFFTELDNSKGSIIGKQQAYDDDRQRIIYKMKQIDSAQRNI